MLFFLRWLQRKNYERRQTTAKTRTKSAIATRKKRTISAKLVSVQQYPAKPSLR